MNGVGYIDLLSGFQGAASAWKLSGEVSGPGIRHASDQFAFGASVQPVLRLPSTWPMTVFIHATRHTTSTVAQAIMCNGGYHPTGGWIFYVNGTGAQTEMLFVEASVLVTAATALGAPVVGGAGNSMAFAIDTGSTSMRFMLNGAFCNGTTNSSIGVAGFPNYVISGDGLGSNKLLDWTVHAIYVWDRKLTDAELTQLYVDPWLLVRERRRSAYGVGTAAGGGSRAFAAIFG